ncbi:replication factor C large subunit [Candidatus Woesearchaeota archaeon]|nr:replication factor C large subunit [Candidatus Woesearchaeota archaeon]
MTSIPLPWAEQYQPQSLQEIKGQDQALSLLQRCVAQKKPVILSGPVGCGKTASVYALAQDLQYEIIEVNTSDFRDKNSIHQIVGSSLQQQSLFSKGKIILVDEVDGIAGNQDRGGVQALAQLLTEAKQAVVMTANDPWDSKFNVLRKSSQVIEFQPVGTQALVAVLQQICSKEGVQCSEEILKKVARKAQGDVRAAITDLEMLTRGKTTVTLDDVDFLEERLREQSMSDALRLVFKSTKAEEVVDAFDRVDSDLPEVLLWLDENLPREYTAEDLHHGYQALSGADVFHGRIMRWQHWRFLVYMNAFLTAGVALAKREKKDGFVDYKRNGRILRYWMAKQKRLKRQGILSTMRGDIHGSSTPLMKEVLPYLIFMLRKNKRMTFGLSQEDIRYLVQ